MNRRIFIQTATVGATSLAGLSWTGALAAEKANWPIDCFNRAWTQWRYDGALDCIAAVKANLED